MDLRKFEGIDWDSEDDPNGNLVHCMEPGRLGPNPERVVHEVLSEAPVKLKIPVKTADAAFVGPDRSRSRLWVVLLDISWKRGDWLRPVTGWPAEPAEIAVWRQRYPRG
jgi:hypothetical protein